MARRPRYLQEIDPVPKSIERHMLAMDFRESRAYFDWCWANGFDGNFDKSRGDLQDELCAFEATLAKRLEQSRLHKKPKVFLKAVCLGEVTSDEIDRPNFKHTAMEIEASNEDLDKRKSLLAMLLALTKYDDLLFQSIPQLNTPVIRGLIKLHDRKTLWLRPIENWKPKSKNLERRFGELTHHLFDKFGDVPRFMETVWLRDDRASWRYRDWYVHLGRGYNLRTAKSPATLTKKMAHYFLQAPDNFTAEQSIRWGQMQALGASENAIHAVASTSIARSFNHEEFWFTVLRFIADNPMLDPRQIGPIIDYLQNQRFETQDIEVAPGQWRQVPPPQAGLSMNGRTVETLMRQVGDWHVSLGRNRGDPSGSYEKALFSGIYLEEKRDGKPNHWAIRQLVTARELQLESAELKHCVASYHSSCARGYCTIWSLSRSEDGRNYERCQTIEVDKNGVIVQCRGLANRDPKPDEWSIVNAWARHADLQISTYL